MPRTVARVRLLAVALVAGVLLWPTAAFGAEPVALVRTAGTPAAVALSGDGVLVAEHLAEARVRAVGASGAARTLFERRGSALQVSSGLAASPGWAAFGFAAVREGFVPAGPVLAGGPGGPFGRLAGAPRAFALDLAGPTLVSVEPGGAGAVRRLVARYLGAFGGARELARGRLLGVVSAAGDFVAYAERAGGRDVAVVLDQTTGEETTRLVLAGALEALDVQSDGKLALATVRSRAETSISWTAPRRPGVHEAARGSRRGGVRIAADRIAFVRHVGIARELAVTDLDGFAAPASFPVSGVEAFDFDGARLAFATPRCVYLERVPGLTVRAAPPAGGPCARSEAAMRAPARAAFSSSRRSLPVRVSCPMATSAGCPVSLTLLAWRGASALELAAVRARVARGAVRTVRLRLSPADLHALRRRDPGPLSLELQPLDAGRRERLQSPVTVTSPRRQVEERPEDDGPGGEFIIG